MSLEQAILDRLEKRNAQIAQLQSTVHALERAADSQREHARQQLAPLIEENKQLAEQITTARLERGQMQHQISELRTECDRIREIAKTLVPKSALKQAVQEAAELHAEAAKLVEENKKLVAQTEDSEVITERRERLIRSLNDEITKRDHELRAHEKELAEQREEIRKLRAEVPLESTREGLKNAVAKLQEVTTEKDRMRLQLENAGADIKQAMVELDSLGSMAADRALEIRKLMDGHAEDMKAQAELLSKHESLLIKITDLGSYAMTLGRKEGEPLEMFMERQALRLAALETKIELRPIENRIGHFAVICTKCDELAKSRTELAEAMERVTQLRSESESLRAELQGYMAGESEAMEAAKVNGIQPFEKLAGFIYRHAACLRQAQAANAPLNKLYFTMRKHRDDCNISANAEPIYRAVDEASEAIKQLTA